MQNQQKSDSSNALELTIGFGKGNPNQRSSSALQPNATNTIISTELSLFPSNDQNLSRSQSTPVYSRYSHHQRRETYTENVNTMNLYSVFRDGNLEKLPLNQFLYLEFLHMSIRVFVALLIFAGLLKEVYAYVTTNVAFMQSVAAQMIATIGYFLSTGLFLRIYREYQERKLVENSILTELPWTEDLFSLLIEGLPRDSTKKEITNFFNNVLQQEGVQGNVKKLIMLQDYHEYAQVKKNIRKLDKQLQSAGISERTKLKLLTKKSTLAGLLGQLEVEIIHLKCFKGKAIIIFDTIEAKNTICEYYQVSNYFASFSRDRKYFFKEKKFRFSKIPQPEDVIFENLHYSTGYRTFVITMTYILSFIVAAGVIIGMLTFKPFTFSLDSLSWDSFTEKMTSYYFIMGILILGFIMRRCYRNINRELIYSSNLQAETNTFIYSIWMSLLFVVPLQLIPPLTSPHASAERQLAIPLLYFLQVLIIKFISILFENRNERRPSNMTLNGLLVTLNTQKSQKNVTELDFSEGINGVIPLIFMAFTSLAINLIYIIPVIIVALYIVIILEKYRIKRFCNIYKSKSATYMLRVFTVFRWDCFCAFGVSVITLTQSGISLSSGSHFVSEVIYVACGLAFLSLLCYIWWPESLDKKVSQEFIKRNLKVTYDSVCKEFTSFYETEDPLGRIRQ